MTQDQHERIMPVSRGFHFLGSEGGLTLPISGLAIGCMDYRFSDEFSAIQADHRTVAYRNAGALLPDMLAEIEIFLMQPQHRIENISVYTHTDCGAIAFIHQVFQGERKVHGEVEARLVRHLEEPLRAAGIDPADVTRSELESFNKQIKYSILAPILEKFSGIKLNVEIADLAHAPNNTVNKPVLLYTTPTNTMTHKEIAAMVLGEEEAKRTKVYLVQRPSVLQALTDFEIAHALGITDLRFVSLGSSQNADVEGDVRMLKKMAEYRPFLSEMQLAHVAFDTSALTQLHRPAEGLQVPRVTHRMVPHA